jgi:hypothetical protein
LAGWSFPPLVYLSVTQGVSLVCRPDIPAVVGDIEPMDIVQYTISPSFLSDFRWTPVAWLRFCIVRLGVDPLWLSGTLVVSGVFLFPLHAPFHVLRTV